MAYPIGESYVKFVRGTPKAWKNLKNKDKDTLYFISEKDEEQGYLYLGDKLISSSEGGTIVGATSLSELGDVIIRENVENNSFLIYDKSQGKWVDKVVPSKILYNSTEYWENNSELIGEAGTFYIYKDYRIYNQKKIPNFKIGDGVTSLKDLPFIDEMFWEHINNSEIHITNKEREYWNNKVTVIAEEEQELIIFTKEEI